MRFTSTKQGGWIRNASRGSELALERKGDSYMLRLNLFIDAARFSRQA